jgi:hypothetical protein
LLVDWALRYEGIRRNASVSPHPLAMITQPPTEVVRFQTTRIRIPIRGSLPLREGRGGSSTRTFRTPGRGFRHHSEGMSAMSEANGANPLVDVSQSNKQPTPVGGCVSVPKCEHSCVIIIMQTHAGARRQECRRSYCEPPEGVRYRPTPTRPERDGAPT